MADSHDTNRLASREHPAPLWSRINRKPH